MTGEEQKNTVAAFAEYLKKEGVSFFVLAYVSDGDLTCSLDAGEDLSSALAFILNDEENGLEQVFAEALAINAKNKGRLIQINNNFNGN